MSTLWVWVEELVRSGSGSIELSRDEARHVTTRRLRIGDSLVVFDGKGHWAEARLESIAQRSVCVDVDVIRETPNPDSGLVIASAIPKGDRLGTMLQMLTQLGLSVWQPVILDESSVRKLDANAPRLQRICIESGKVARRAWRLEIRDPATLDVLLDRQSDSTQVWFGDREGQAKGMDNIDKEASLIIIGPEAGFSEAERKRLESAGARSVSFGSHNLRIETAAVAAMATANLLKGP
jgi:16S rRNA (uracil1498-N3)-methyltransferase